MENDKPQASADPVACGEHGQTAKWSCGICGQPLCTDCRPVAYNYQVFHPACLEAGRKRQESKSRDKKPDAPSGGVRFVAWVFLVMAIVLFGCGLLLLGVSFFSQHYVPLASWAEGTWPVLDEIPGSRSVLGWAGALALLTAGVQAALGIGLLNCIMAARRVILLFSWLEVVFAAAAWLVIWVSGKGLWDIPVAGVALIIFFSRKKVKQQFQVNP